MKLLFDFFPVILYFLTYKQANFLIENTFAGQLINPEDPEFISATFLAIGVAIISSFVQVGIHWFKTRAFERMHIISLSLIAVLGTITIFIGDPVFFQWKPTLLNWLFAVVFLGSMFIGDKPIIQRMMGEHISLPNDVWRTLNLSWIAFFFISGAANLYVAFYYNISAADNVRMDAWVDFKLFGLMGLTLGFIILQALYLSRHISEDDVEDKDTEQKQENP
ncbi:Intracellular septation protein IspA [hydrothermal vent metagenome]|uniref:Intracellular septation protein IspA n=1 Tax=hydrothermal vent metagenome TaxID=652676 RepID=A0A3B0WVE2_9ZZZZ